MKLFMRKLSGFLFVVVTLLLYLSEINTLSVSNKKTGSVLESTSSIKEKYRKNKTEKEQNDNKKVLDHSLPNYADNLDHHKDLILNSEENPLFSKPGDLSFLEIQDKSGLSNKSEISTQLSAEAQHEMMLKEGDAIAERLKKEIEEYAKVKKTRKPKEQKDDSELNNDIELIEKYSTSKYLPQNVNEKLNTYRIME